MNLEINYDGVRVDDVSLTPDESENVDVLYNYSRNLLVKNPAVDFSERVRFRGHEYYLVSNAVSQTTKELKQSVQLVRWY